MRPIVTSTTFALPELQVAYGNMIQNEERRAWSPFVEMEGRNPSLLTGCSPYEIFCLNDNAH